MAEMILPGVYIEVRPEGLIVPGQITVGNVGIVGTAARGPIGTPVLLGSYADALQQFHTYDAWNGGRSDELTLVRALEQAFKHGATTVFAVRVAGASKKKAATTLASATGNAAVLTAKTEGTWGNDLEVNVVPATGDATVSGEQHTGASPVKLKYAPVVTSRRTRIVHHANATGITRSLDVIYDDTVAPPTPGQVKIDRTTGNLTFGDPIFAADEIDATYVVSAAKAVTVTVRSGRAEEKYTVLDGDTLVAAVGDPLAGSAWVDATVGSKPAEAPTKSASATTFASLTGGDDGASGAAYQGGLDALLGVDAHLIVAAGQDEPSIGNAIDAHCQLASTDVVKRDRIGVVGSAVGATLDDMLGHKLSSDRVILVAPGMLAQDQAATPPVAVKLPGAYTAAAIAGRLAALSPHVSLTNKVLAVDGLDRTFSAAELTQLVQHSVLAIEQRLGFRVVRGITSAPPGDAFAQITTRRIVDYAKYGVRSSATPYIGLLNNDRVRGALRATINSFLADMVQAEMLVSYELSVSATRDEERKGVARVTITLRPTFSIDFIKVTMFLD